MRISRLQGVLGCTVLLALGCGGGAGPAFHHVSGKATFDGKPIVYGNIEFIPDAQKGNNGPATTAEIEDGAYDTRKGERGVIAGAYQVRITAYEQRPQPASEDETKPSTSAPPLFVGYAMTAEELKESKDFDVPAAAKGFGLTTGAPVRRANDP